MRGFALIELVIVIIILGVVASVAVPKFIDLSTDARISSIRGLEGQIKSSVSLVYNKAVVKGLDKGEQQLTLEDNTPAYPTPSQGSDCFAMYSVSIPTQKPFYAGTRTMTNGC